MSEVIVFAGPCRPRRPDAEWRRLLDRVEVRPPAQRGDLLAALVDRPSTLVLLDGYYYSRPAVSHKEILYALDEGVRVIGAASMGALRAAEMETCGMIGIGRIFEHYRDGVLEGDDEVALLHLPASHDYRPLTLALIELRHSLEVLTRRRQTGAGAARRLVQAARQLPFSERDEETLGRLAVRHLGAAAAALLERALAEESLKRRDALQAMRIALDRHPAAAARSRPPTGFFNHFRELHLRRPDRGDSTVSYLEAWAAAQVLHPAAEELVRRVRRRFLLASASRRRGLQPAPRRVAEIARRIAAQLDRNGHPLPAQEHLEEARQEALAELVPTAFGTAGEDPARAEEKALAELAGWLGLPRQRSEDELLGLLERDPGGLRPWHLTRSFLRTPASVPAHRAAAAAAEICACFRRRAGSNRIALPDLVALAAELWDAAEPEVPARALRRGLPGPADPAFRDTLERFAPAERLPRPINDYPARKAALAATPVDADDATGGNFDPDPPN